MKANFTHRQKTIKEKVERVIIADEDLPLMDEEFFDAVDEAHNLEKDHD